ncbi:hypothetical protein ACHGLA_36135 [Streptomyces sp. YH02]|uniref:hypothetical protein n=1 Tax=Streptomyces sp. YH02 TaxID=3256999 RepID=UPI003757A4AC
MDGSPDGREAVAFAVAVAFAEARLLGGELVARHAWSTGSDHDESGPGHPVELVDLIGAAEQLREAEDRVLAEAVAGRQARYPEVTVRRRVVLIEADAGPI